MCPEQPAGPVLALSKSIIRRSCFSSGNARRRRYALSPRRLQPRKPRLRSRTRDSRDHRVLSFFADLPWIFLQAGDQPPVRGVGAHCAFRPEDGSHRLAAVALPTCAENDDDASRKCLLADRRTRSIGAGPDPGKGSTEERRGGPAPRQRLAVPVPWVRANLLEELPSRRPKAANSDRVE